MCEKLGALGAGVGWGGLTKLGYSKGDIEGASVPLLPGCPEETSFAPPHNPKYFASPQAQQQLETSKVETLI